LSNSDKMTIKLAANLHFMFTELPYLDRIEAASGEGFRGVEAFLLEPVSVPELRGRLDACGMELVHIYAKPGDFEAGEVGVAIYEDRMSEFRESMLRAIADASTLGCALISCLTGKRSGSSSEGEEETTLLKNLEWAAQRCSEQDITLLIEPISNQGPEYFLRYTADARKLIDTIASPNLRLLYDVYHAQMLEGNLTQTILDNLDVLGHIQVADVPGRNEPGSGEINYEFLFKSIGEAYDGWVGCEYRPFKSTSEGLGWATRYLTANER
jgi:hydroxypyruvate isomerase